MIRFQSPILKTLKLLSFLLFKKAFSENSNISVITLSIYRSEAMCLYHLVIHSDEAYQVANLLGDLSCAQIIDLNPNLLPYQHRYIKELK